MEKLLASLGDHFIGLWRYRLRAERRYYVCTVHVNGHYFDSGQKTTIEGALREGIRVVKAELRGEKMRCKRVPPPRRRRAK